MLTALIRPDHGLIGQNVFIFGEQRSGMQMSSPGMLSQWYQCDIISVVFMSLIAAALTLIIPETWFFSEKKIHWPF